ncbi:MAG TPA: FeoA family protein [Phenylobacterium sp.]|nr:FeoA family protein [Phenylobacterium sp.]
MNDLSMDRTALMEAGPAEAVVVRLGDAELGARGTIVEVRAEVGEVDHGVDAAELQRRLLEFGFVEGARIEVIHEGAIGHDPIVVRLDDMRVALRRRDAGEVLVLLDRTPAAR